MNVQVLSLTYDMASMVEFKEFVVNFEQKEWFGTTSILGNVISRLIGCPQKSLIGVMVAECAGP